MSLTLDEVRRIAHLARIAVSPEEAREVADRLNRVLGLIDQIQALDTRGVEPMAHPLDAKLPVQQRLRPDAVTEPDRREAYQQGVAPAVEGGLYLVPKVIE
jgi:aspartyl-tRNA(Asn)/glutamyl-tRNA(Gln) amidotransferase subunit C